jgi:predicted nucleotidyltransferase
MVSPITAEEALARLPDEERRWIEEFRDRLRAEYGARLRDLRLFGSKARGEWDEESDIDLLVLLDGCDLETSWAVLDIARSISPWLSPHTYDFERYHEPASRATGFYKEMRKESVRL